LANIIAGAACKKWSSSRQNAMQLGSKGDIFGIEISSRPFLSLVEVSSVQNISVIPSYWLLGSPLLGPQYMKGSQIHYDYLPITIIINQQGWIAATASRVWDADWHQPQQLSRFW